jgi:hypothetical protein
MGVTISAGAAARTSTKLGVRDDWAPPRLEPGKARQFVVLQRKDPVQLFDQSARARSMVFVLNYPYGHGRRPAKSCFATGRNAASATTLD